MLLNKRKKTGWGLLGVWVLLLGILSVTHGRQVVEILNRSDGSRLAAVASAGASSETTPWLLIAGGIALFPGLLGL